MLEYTMYRGDCVFKYSFMQWMMFFYTYCFIGWVIESTIDSINQKKFINRGFLRIPMLPLYGFGAIIILFSTLPVIENPTLVFICGALSCTLLEYITGVIMESLFKVKYWDYSEFEYNLNGKICIMATLFWGFLSLLLTYQIHQFTQKFILKIPETATIVCVTIITLIFVVDLFYSVKSALDVKKILAKLTEIKNEIERLVSQSVEKSEAAQMIKEKINHLNSERQKLFAKITFYPRQLLKSNPQATSSKFSDALKEVKNIIFNRKNKNKE